MRALGNPFCAVCRLEIISTLFHYSKVEPTSIVNVSITHSQQGQFLITVSGNNFSPSNTVYILEEIKGLIASPKPMSTSLTDINGTFRTTYINSNPSSNSNMEVYIVDDNGIIGIGQYNIPPLV